MPEGIVLLEIEPDFRARFESLGEAEGHVGRDGPSFVDDLGKRLAGYLQDLRQISHRKGPGFHKIIFDELPRMCRRPFPFQ